MTIDTIREDHKHCTEDECHAWDRDVIVRSMVMACHVTTVLADADRLAEALGSDDDGYCRECKRMVYETAYEARFDRTSGDRLDRHADDCKTGQALRQHEGKP